MSSIPEAALGHRWRWSVPPKVTTFMSVSSRAFSQEKLDHMVAYGATLTLVPYEGGGITKQLILDMVEAARKITEQPKTFWANHLTNTDSVAGYFPLGEEIWSQTGRRGASLRGVATVLKRHNPRIKIVAVEPAVCRAFRRPSGRSRH